MAAGGSTRGSSLRVSYQLIKRNRHIRDAQSAKSPRDRACVWIRRIVDFCPCHQELGICIWLHCLNSDASPRRSVQLFPCGRKSTRAMFTVQTKLATAASSYFQGRLFEGRHESMECIGIEKIEDGAQDRQDHHDHDRNYCETPLPLRHE